MVLTRGFDLLFNIMFNRDVPKYHDYINNVMADVQVLDDPYPGKYNPEDSPLVTVMF